MGLADDQYIRSNTGLDDPVHLPEIPGAELDDAFEAIGKEDEENNYYRLGGDNHDNLEENSRNNNN